MNAQEKLNAITSDFKRLAVEYQVAQLELIKQEKTYEPLSVVSCAGERHIVLGYRATPKANGFVVEARLLALGNFKLDSIDTTVTYSAQPLAPSFFADIPPQASGLTAKARTYLKSIVYDEVFSLEAAGTPQGRTPHDRIFKSDKF